MEETYTFSRALHMMRYSGKKMRSEFWSDRTVFISVTNNNLLFDCGANGTLTQREIMGSWVEVKQIKEME